MCCATCEPGTFSHVIQLPVSKDCLIDDCTSLPFSGGIVSALGL